MADHATTMEVYPTCTVVSALPPGGLNLRDELQRYQEWLVDQALIRTNGNRAAAARLLGLKRTTLVMMLKTEAPMNLGPRCRAKDGTSKTEGTAARRPRRSAGGRRSSRLSVVLRGKGPSLHDAGTPLRTPRPRSVGKLPAPQGSGGLVLVKDRAFR